MNKLMMLYNVINHHNYSHNNRIISQENKISAQLSTFRNLCAKLQILKIWRARFRFDNDICETHKSIHTIFKCCSQFLTVAVHAIFGFEPAVL